MRPSSRHPMASTSEELRTEIRQSSLSSRVLAQRYGINQKTVLKWRKRESPADRSSRPHHPQPRAFSPQEEEIALGFRILTQLPLDDCLYALAAAIPNLSRSTLHRFFASHGAGRIVHAPQRGQDDAPAPGRLRSGVLRGRAPDLDLLAFVAIDACTRLFFGRIYDARDDQCLPHFLQGLEAFLPYPLVSIAFRAQNGDGETGEQPCNGMTSYSEPAHWHENYERERRLLILDAGAPDGMIGAGDDVAVVTPFYESIAQAQMHMDAFSFEYNLSRRLKVLGGSTPAQFVQKLMRRRNGPVPCADPLEQLRDQLLGRLSRG